jgi:hypothetical protein
VTAQRIRVGGRAFEVATLRIPDDGQRPLKAAKA